ncbi:ornithine carbamoyltransferase [candidate division KSB1 bacterium]|nr:ornithine carbamoyltransferase [candidate division KSB1 bacterium]
MKKDFIAISELSKDEIFELFARAIELKEKTKRHEAHPLLLGKTLAMIFQKPSARTRISFEVGMYQLGGYALYLAPTDISMGKRESIADVARTISRYCDGIMARVFGHEQILELAKHATVPVVNGLTDLLHPCQVMGDMLTILEHRGNLEAITVAFIGDGNNLANSWINMAARVPMTLHLAIPEGYDPNPEILKSALKSRTSSIRIFRNPIEAVKNADVIYTDVWASMGQEAEAEKRRIDFRNFQVNDELVGHANSQCLVMHCLPAHRGEEITDSVIEGSNSVVFDEAENRLHIQKAILAKLMA